MKTYLSILLLALTQICNADLPADAAHLRALRNAKIAEINRTYVAELTKLRDQYTRAGWLEEANMLTQEIKSIENKADQASGSWKWGSGGMLELGGDGRAKHSAWKNPGIWTRKKNGEILIQSDQGQSFVVRMDSKNLRGEVTNLEDQSKTNIVKIETISPNSPQTQDQ